MTFAVKDKASKTFDFKGGKKTPEGYLVFTNVKLARTGIQDYLAIELGSPAGFKATDTVRVYRPAEEVFKDESMRTFELKPMTNDHPKVMVDTAIIDDVKVGVSGGRVFQDGEYLVVDKLIVHSASAILDIEAGKVELSNGYFCDYVFEKGVTPEGEAYDAIQRNIAGNHIALVSKGRCGGTCSISDNQPPNQGKINMTIVKKNLGGVDCEVDQATAKLIDLAIDQAVGEEKVATATVKNELLTTKSELKTAEAENETLTGERDAALAEVEKLKTAKPTSDAIQTALTDHLAVIDKVKKINPNFDCAGKSSDELVKAIVVDANKDETFDDTKDAGYYNARLDQMLKFAKDGGASTVTDGDGDIDHKDAADKARQERLDRNKKRFSKGGKA